MDIFLLYVWTRLDVVTHFVKTIAIISTIIFAITIIALGICYLCDEINLSLKIRKIMSFILKFLLPAVVLFIALPSSKDVALILGGSTVLEAARSEPAKRLAGKSVQVIEQAIDAYLKKDINDAQELKR